MSKKSNGSSWGINKFSFWLFVFLTILFAVTLVLSAIGGTKLLGIVKWLQVVVEALMILVVAVLAWRYVRNKQVVWKVLYFICLCVVLACIVVPRVL